MLKLLASQVLAISSWDEHPGFYRDLRKKRRSEDSVRLFDRHTLFGIFILNPLNG